MSSAEERPPSLLAKKPLDAKVVSLGVTVALGAHLVIPVLLLASQWLLVMLGLAIPAEERKRPTLPDNVIAAEFVKLGKPFDPTKLPNRKVPPVAKRKPQGVAVSADAQEQPKKPEEKERPAEAKDSLLDNLVDRTKDFAEDVEVEEEGSPDGIPDGTATEAKAGDLYLGQLTLFFRRNWTVPNVVQNVDGMTAIAAVEVDAEGRIRSVAIQKSSGDPLFDQSIVDAVQALIEANASIPAPPVDLASRFYDAMLPIRFRGSEAR